MIGDLRKYLFQHKKYCVCFLLSEKQTKLYGDVMDVKVKVLQQDGSGVVYKDRWCEAYCSIQEFKKRYDLTKNNNVIIEREVK